MGLHRCIWVRSEEEKNDHLSSWIKVKLKKNKMLYYIIETIDLRTSKFNDLLTFDFLFLIFNSKLSKGQNMC